MIYYLRASSCTRILGGEDDGGDDDGGDVYDADGDEDDDVVDISREGLCVRIPNLSRNIAPSTFCFLTPMTVMCKSISQQRFPSELCITSYLTYFCCTNTAI